MRSPFYSFIIGILFASCSKNLPNINGETSLPDSLVLENADFKAISSITNPKSQTTSILLGNSSALQAFKMPAIALKGEKILVLVTWLQRNDPRWFGAKTPSDFMMMEVLKTNENFSEKDKISYEFHKGKNFKRNVETDIQSRIAFITSIQPAVMP